ncbi:hypothetical protein ACFWY5_24135 [Nonomuraea sp. NPDC059007]
MRAKSIVRNDWMLVSVVMRELVEAEPRPDLPMSAYELAVRRGLRRSAR